MVVAMLGGYWWAIRHLAHWYAPPGESPVTNRQIAAFVAGAVTLLISQEWPLHNVAEDAPISAHMVEHLLLALAEISTDPTPDPRFYRLSLDEALASGRPSGSVAQLAIGDIQGPKSDTRTCLFTLGTGLRQQAMGGFVSRLTSHVPRLANPPGVAGRHLRWGDKHPVVLAHENGTDCATLPSVVVFATPAFCQTATCGPILEETKVLADDYPEVDFVHVEVYENLDAESTEDLQVVEAVTAWSLASEPWVFVTDAAGIITARFEGVASADEIHSAIDEITR